MELSAWRQRVWSHVPQRLQRPLSLGARAVQMWLDELGPQLGASIAFYAMFALAPLLVVAITLAGAFFGPEAARGQIVGEIQGLVGVNAARSIEVMIESSWRSEGSGLAGMLGMAALLLGASGVFVALRNALNRLGRLPEMPSGVGAFVRARLVAFALVLGFGFLAIVSLLASAALAAVGAYLSGRYPPLAPAIAAMDIVVSSLVLTFGFAALLRWLPESPPGWHAVFVGAAASAVLFAVGKHLIGLYLGRAGVASSYGAAGSFVVVMLWVYYSSQILLLGAALAWTVDGAQLRPRLNEDGTPSRDPVAAGTSGRRSSVR
ncbi:YihY/virulence factor BrkB family protein [Schlegelella sp. S2-27]|uniref:YihY/virulence factor BrkB family protein n=1 Tax=Caldimonas mangrovi TaxID=2944811 RepID=A0ABT0YHQ2_9BURK|nr:YihY/virulence factor BrkB family protein [Caldimonas mangrovi]MCM5677954.1 YihY/virulence factor BrkB family protein [Caldimonas mangrovi]